jgi:hypothetical protein
MRRVSRCLSYPNVMASIALFLALTGGAYAVTGNPFVGKHGVVSVCVQPNNEMSVAAPGTKWSPP